jgi:hypothetical protein
MINKNLGQIEWLIESLNAVGFKEDQLANLKNKIEVALVPHMMDKVLFLTDLVTLIKESANLFGLEPIYGLLEKYSIDDFFVRVDLERLLASLRVTGFNEDQLAKLRLKIDVDLHAQPMDKDSISERFWVLQTASNSLGVEAISALLEEFDLTALLERSPGEWMFESLRGVGLLEGQLARLRIKMGTEFRGQPLDNHSFSESLEVVVKTAISSLGVEAASALLEECKIADLLQRSVLTEYCVNRLLVFPSPTDFGVSCRAMRGYIEEHKDYILKTGLMPRSFPNSSLLTKCFARFYNTKITSSPLPLDADSSVGQVVTKDPYTFMREVVELDDSSFEHLTRYEPSSFEDATLIPILKPVHNRSLHNVRPKVIKLALETLALLEDDSNKDLSVNDLVAKFGSLVVSNLSREEFVELIKVDDALGQTKAGFESESTDWLHIDWHLTSSLRGCGLLTSLIELLIYFIELKSVDSLLVDPLNIKTVEALRSVSNTLAGDASYFSAIAGHPDKAVLDEFLERVSELVKGGIQWRGTTIGLLNEVFSIWSSPLPVLPGSTSLATRVTNGSTNYFGKLKSGSKTASWIFTFDGSGPFYLPESINFECIKMLLENPKKIISNGDLIAKKVRMGSDSSALDSEVAEDYISGDYDEDFTPRKRGSGIDASSVSMKQMFEKKNSIETELASTGLSEVERAKKKGDLADINRCINHELEYRKNPIIKTERKSLGKSIHRGISEIMISCPKFGQHLKLFMKPVSGSGWSYFPDSKMNWDTHDR